MANRGGYATSSSPKFDNQAVEGESVVDEDEAVIRLIRSFRKKLSKLTILFHSSLKNGAWNIQLVVASAKVAI